MSTRRLRDRPIHLQLSTHSWENFPRRRRHNRAITVGFRGPSIQSRLLNQRRKTVTSGTTHVTQCKKPSGLLGRFVLWNMNSRHSKVTDWGLSKISIRKQDIILDAGCGGGRTVSKLAAIAAEGKVYGLDFSTASVAFAKRTNRHWIDAGRVEIQEGSVSHLPFADDMFDLVTAVETHFWWPDLPADMLEVLRVLKPGGCSSSSRKYIEERTPELPSWLRSTFHCPA